MEIVCSQKKVFLCVPSQEMTVLIKLENLTLENNIQLIARYKKNMRSVLFSDSRGCPKEYDVGRVHALLTERER